MKYSVTSIPAKPGETLRIRLVSKGTLPKVAMAHNVVVLKLAPSRSNSPTPPPWRARPTYIPPDMKDQVLAATAMAGPGETVEVTVQGADRAGQLSVHVHVPRALRRRDARHDRREVVGLRARLDGLTSRARCPR